MRRQAYKYLLGKKVAQKRVQLVRDGHVRLAKACQLKIHGLKSCSVKLLGIYIVSSRFAMPHGREHELEFEILSNFFVLFQLLLLLVISTTDHSE